MSGESGAPDCLMGRFGGLN